MNEFLKLRAEYLFHYFANCNVAARRLNWCHFWDMQNTFFFLLPIFPFFSKIYSQKGWTFSQKFISRLSIHSGVVIHRCTCLKRKLIELLTCIKWNEPMYQMICPWPCVKERAAHKGKLLSSFEIPFQTMFTIYWF